MKRGLTLASILALLLLLAYLAPTTAASPGDFKLLYADWRSVDGGPAAPGRQVVVEAFIVFRPPDRDDVAYDVIATLIPPEPLTPPAAPSSRYDWVSAMKLGDVRGLKFTLTLPPNATPGEYAFKLKLEYRYVATEGVMGEYREQGFTFTLPLRPHVGLHVEPLATSLVKGASQRLKLKLSCVGSSGLLVTSLAASSAQASIRQLEPQPPLLLEPGGSVEASMDLYVPKAASSVSLTLEARYLADGLERASAFTFSLPAVEALKPLRVEAGGYELKPGALNRVVLKLSNAAEGDVESVRLKLSCRGLAVVGPDELRVAKVPSGGEVEVEVLVKLVGGSPQYAMDIQLSYAAEGLIYEDEASLLFTESRGPKLSFTAVEVSRSGVNVYVRGQVINIGNGKANYVNVTAYSRDLALERPTTYVGSLEPGEAASFLITGRAEREGVYHVDLKASYADEAGGWLTEVGRVDVIVERAAAVEGGAGGIPPSSLIIPLAMLSAGLLLSGLLIGRYVGRRHEA
jgi:hypothetical protein